jgi:hypothetical protein
MTSILENSSKITGYWPGFSKPIQKRTVLRFGLDFTRMQCSPSWALICLSSYIIVKNGVDRISLAPNAHGSYGHLLMGNYIVLVRNNWQNLGKIGSINPTKTSHHLGSWYVCRHTRISLSPNAHCSYGHLLMGNYIVLVGKNWQNLSNIGSINPTKTSHHLGSWYVCHPLYY